MSTLDPAGQPEPDDTRWGKLILEIVPPRLHEVLRLYENEVWRVALYPDGTTIGGSLGGARAEVLMQTAINVNATQLHVMAPTFDFTFALPHETAKKNRVRLDQFNWIAEFINNRGRELAQTELPAPSGAAHSVADEIAKFAALRDQGILTSEEFAAKKAQLLA